MGTDHRALNREDMLRRQSSTAPEWQPIETAPKDGTRVWLINRTMKQPVIGEWGDHMSLMGKLTKQWIVTHDPLNPHFPSAYGRLCCPDLWMPLPNPPKTGE
jgi:hypothetical protein